MVPTERHGLLSSTTRIYPKGIFCSKTSSVSVLTPFRMIAWYCVANIMIIYQYIYIIFTPKQTYTCSLAIYHCYHHDCHALPMTISSAPQEAPDTLVSDISPKALQTGGQAAAWNFWCLVGGEIRLSIAADRTILCQFVSRTTMGCHQHVILANRSNRQFSTKWCSRKTKGWPDMYN